MSTGPKTGHKPRELSPNISLAIVAWPAVLWIIAFLAATLARHHGCVISARGPHECLILGQDIGDLLYPLWARGYYLVFAMLWVPVGLVILAIARHAHFRD